MIDAPVNRILDFSFVDGPGNRTVIFLQGCNYRCTYCHNPETMQCCCACGRCVPACPQHALSLTDGVLHWDKALCCACDRCIRVCPHQASPRVRRMDVAALIEHIRKNRPFIQGITVSGGECTLQAAFLRQLFHEAHQLGLHCLIDSNGSFDFSADPALLEETDGVMLDIKAVRPETYLAITGKENPGILEQAAFLAERGRLTEVRTVCAPGLDSAHTVSAAARTLARWDVLYHLIAYRPNGVRLPYLEELSVPDASFLAELKTIALEAGIKRVVIT